MSMYTCERPMPLCPKNETHPVVNICTTTTTQCTILARHFTTHKIHSDARQENSKSCRRKTEPRVLKEQKLQMWIIGGFNTEISHEVCITPHIKLHWCLLEYENEGKYNLFCVSDLKQISRGLGCNHARFMGPGVPDRIILINILPPCLPDMISAVVSPCVAARHTITWQIQGLLPANERRWYFVTTSLIGWVQA